MSTSIVTKISDEKILVKRYYPSGELKFEGLYGRLNEMPSELVDEENGTEVTLDNYSTAPESKDGLSTWWYDNGNKDCEFIYKDGKPDGEHTSWFKDGRMEFEGTMTPDAIKIGEWHDGRE